MLDLFWLLVSWVFCVWYIGVLVFWLFGVLVLPWKTFSFKQQTTNQNTKKQKNKIPKTKNQKQKNQKNKKKYQKSNRKKARSTFSMERCFFGLLVSVFEWLHRHDRRVQARHPDKARTQRWERCFEGDGLSCGVLMYTHDYKDNYGDQVLGYPWLGE